ncbi:hypothetical protein BGZ94_006845 [Podila epigama]|nr:hypothetical protein BGZ94_006845 [Podila epigama]
MRQAYRQQQQQQQQRQQPQQQPQQQYYHYQQQSASARYPYYDVPQFANYHDHSGFNWATSQRQDTTLVGASSTFPQGYTSSGSVIGSYAPVEQGFQSAHIDHSEPLTHPSELSSWAEREMSATDVEQRGQQPPQQHEQQQHEQQEQQLKHDDHYLRSDQETSEGPAGEHETSLAADGSSRQSEEHAQTGREETDDSQQ